MQHTFSLSFLPAPTSLLTGMYKQGHEMQHIVLIFPFIFFLEVTLKCKEY